MNRFGLLGRTLGHSFSPAIHAALGNTDYGLFEVEPDALASILQTPTLQGLNVTIPYKKTVLPYCASVSDRARRIGCVNTMLRRADGKWHGTNTDYDGFAYLLDQLQAPVADSHCVILGNGATAQTVSTVLQDRKAGRITFVARRGDAIPFDQLHTLKDAAILINTTPVGMYPHCPERLVEIDALPQLKAVCDVIYNPRRSQLLQDAEALGIASLDGLPMLVAQAVAAAIHFQNEESLWDALPGILKQMRQDNENIVLIGMPGSGKTSVGLAVAEAMARPFIDIDAQVAEIHGPVASLIDKYGIAYFRKLESAALKEAGKQHGLVIATGGGTVTVPENYACLRQNGRIYWLQRPLEELDTEGRPLSRGGRDALEGLARERMPLYAAFSDVTLHNETISHTAQHIQEDFYETAHLERS